MHASDGGGAVTLHGADAAARGHRARLPDRAVLPRRRDGARAVSRLRRAAGREHGLRAEQHRASAARRWRRRRRRWTRRRAAAGDVQPGRSRKPGYIAPDPKDPDIFFAGGNNGVVPRRRRTGARARAAKCSPYPRMFSGEPSSDAGRAHAVDVPDRLLAGRSERALHGDAARVEDARTAARLGQASAAISRATIRRRWADSGGPITRDMNGPEVYATVFAHWRRRKTDVNVIWTGSDDGLDQRHARRRQDVDERDAEGHAGLRPRQHHRRVGVRRRRRRTSP